MQLTLDLPAAGPGVCQYGTPGPGARPVCDAPATHAAVCVTVPHQCPLDCPLPHSHVADGHTARLVCCRAHADYYASAWAGVWLLTYPQALRAQHTSVWIEVLGP